MVKTRVYIKETLSKINAQASRRWALRIFYSFVFVAIFANFIANDKPYFCSYQGQWYAPVFKAVSVDFGLSQWPAEHINLRWYNQDLDWAIWPPVHYSSSQKDLKNRFASPFGKQSVKNNWFRHWLGTDELGHDVLAVLIWGTRTAILIGFGAAIIAGLIGIFLGAIAGFFGDKGYQLARSQITGILIGGILGLFIGFIARQHLWFSSSKAYFILGGIAIFIVLTYGCSQLFKKIKIGQWGNKKTSLPLDNIIMRSIETLNAIPGLLLLLSIVAILPKPSILSIVLILGFLSWTGIARFVRSELMRIRSLEYIEAGKTLGFNNQRILWLHALPNAMGPVFVSLTFTIAGAIITEASLSFLGIGMPTDVITWGHLLSNARQSPSAWWLAIFPGLAISGSILTLYTLGEAFSSQK